MREKLKGIDCWCVQKSFSNSRKEHKRVFTYDYVTIVVLYYADRKQLNKI